jgi:hypothetical protein
VVFCLNFFIFRRLIDITAAAAVAAMLGPSVRSVWTGRLGSASLVAGLLPHQPLSSSYFVAYAVLLGYQAVGLFSWLLPQLEPEALYNLWMEIPARYPWLERLKDGSCRQTLRRLC